MSDKIYLIGQGSGSDSELIGYALTVEEARAICAEHNTQVFISVGDMDSESYWCEEQRLLKPAPENIGRETAYPYIVRLYSARSRKLLRDKPPRCEPLDGGRIFAGTAPKIVTDQILDEPTSLRLLEIIVPASTPEEAVSKAEAIEKKMCEKNK